MNLIKPLLILLLIASNFRISLAQVGALDFRSITTENGLSTNYVSCITQDSQGFMWFGTAYGLNRYDGNEFKIYLHDTKDPEGITWSSIASILEDSKGTLWIGTGGRGLNRFDKEKEKFIAYWHDENDSTSLSNEDGINVYEDRQGRIWIGTMYGLNLYDHEKDQFIRYIHNKNNPNSINPEPITCIYEDSKNNLWIGTTGGGLELFNRETGKVVHFKHNPENPNSIRNNYVRSIFEDSEGTLWIGTDRGFDRLFYSTHEAIFRYVEIKKGISPYVSSEKALNLYKKKGSSKLINAFHRADFIDNRGNIWIGTAYEGVKFYNPLRDVFNTYKYQPDDPNGLKNRSVLAICENSDGNLWIGVDHGGLHLYNRKKNTFRYIPLDQKTPNNPFDESVLTIEEDSYGDLWIGTWGKGVYKFEKNTGKQVHYMPDENNPASLNCPIVRYIFEDSRKNIWLGTNGGGVNLYNRKNDSFSQVTELGKSDTFIESYNLSKGVYYIYEDNKENLWFCTGWGLYLFDRDSKKVKNWVHDRNDSTTVSGLHVQLIHEDSKGNLWVGTWYGLNLFNRDSVTFTRYNTKDGLPAQNICGMIEDNHGNLWISTGYGISKFNPINKTFKNYDVNDGLQGQGFNDRAFAKLKTGELIFGGTDGFTIFHPDSIKNVENIPPVVITDFQVFNKTVKPGDKDSPLQKSINLTDEIILPYYSHSILFEFAALDYINPKNNRYKFFLEGFHKDWIETTADHRVAAFTNLHPGTYIFRVKGSNSKGVWNNEGVSIKIIITPPWWKTIWAYIVYILLSGLIVWLIWKEQLRRVHMRQELQMKQFEADKLQELDQLKSRFFANISHEIRTPLTLILGPLEQLISEAAKEKWKKQLQIMFRNGRHLLQLINQLLDFSKLESGRMSLRAKEMNIVPLLKGMVHSFDSLAKHRQISLTFKSEEEAVFVYIDPEKLEKIMANLLSNAFKFTSEREKISVCLSICGGEPPFAPATVDKMIEIRVEDTGTGISSDQLMHIFERYYQVGDKNQQSGTGIGLALTKELVELHHGHIKVESELDKGATFFVYIPMGKDHLENGEIIRDQKVEVTQYDSVQEEMELLPEDTIETQVEVINKSKPAVKRDFPILLIVEDTEDVRTYMREFLAADYQIFEAQDGEEGFEKSIETIPDLIISDVMMPKMDGFQLCEKLKTDERTSHIPVILLTARASEGSKLEGLETGADDYLVKPFNAKELTIRIKNLIEQRRKLRERFTRDITLSPKDITVTSADERFLERAIEIIENYMGDSDFGVDLFGKEVGLSHSQLHRKIRALTNQSPVEFIRTLRLKRAASLLRQKYGNVAEIAYEVGFNNPAYFAECFRKLFGKSPSEYTAKNQM